MAPCGFWVRVEVLMCQCDMRYGLDLEFTSLLKFLRNREKIAVRVYNEYQSFCPVLTWS